MGKYRRNDCRYCGSKNLSPILNLGSQPPSNSFITLDEVQSEKYYPLELFLCNGCSLVQLLDVISAQELFDDYHYLSSSSGALVMHFKELTKMLATEYGLEDGNLVVDIGCNDGITLNAYEVPGLVRVGVEPSRVSQMARNAGLDVIGSFFNADISKQIIAKYGQARVITATNVFAHVDDMHSFIAGIHPLLCDDGVFVVEVAYLIDLIDNNLFDTIYHEHLCYLSLLPVSKFLKQYNLLIFHVERLSVGPSGPAIRFHIKKSSSSREISESVADLASDEVKWGVTNLQNYKQFANRVKELKTNTCAILNNLKDQGFRIGAFGAPAKGNTLLNYYGLSTEIIDCIADNTVLKQGKITPGSHISIVSDDEFLEKMPEYALLLTWNYLDFFLEHSQYIKEGGRFIVPFPIPRIMPSIPS
jgi:hypothetical protein|tara:strand:+ start:2384 stop:3634 length:1251 start_codon:yes stop_codon:yes gene_type:complete